MFSHPSDVCMTYICHLTFAVEISIILFIGSIKSLIHAIIPDLFITSTSDLIIEIEKKLRNSGCR